MKRGAVILSIAVICALAFIWRPWHPGNTLSASARPDSSARLHPSRPPETKPESSPGDPSPEAKQLIAQLIHAREAWLADLPVWRKQATHGEAWLKFALEQLSSIETARIAEIAAFIDDPRIGDEIDSYRNALFLTWGLRDPAGARSAMMLRAGAITNRKGGLEGTNNELDWVSNDFHFIRTGHSMGDPAAACDEIRKDLADPDMEAFVSEHTLEAIFRNYAAKSPDEAWRVILATPNAQLAGDMFKGFTEGAPEGTDWLAFTAKLLATPQGQDLLPDWLARTVAQRWVTEDPEATLEWYGHHAELDNNTFFAPPPDDPVSSLSPEIRARIELIQGLGDYRHDASDEVAAILDRLIARATPDDITIVRQVLDHRNELPLGNPAFLALVTKIQDPAVRSQVFLDAVSRIPERERDPFGDTSSLEGPNEYLPAMRDFAARLDLPQDVREKASAAFKSIEDREAEARKTEDDPDDPFR